MYGKLYIPVHPMTELVDELRAGQDAIADGPTSTAISSGG